MLEIDNSDEITTQYFEFETEYYNITSKAKDLLNKVNANSANNYSGRSSPHSHGSCSVHSNSHSFIKLPTISLPKFKGDIENWIEFREIFNDLIHENSSIKEIQKLHYLKASLTGEASDLIKLLIHKHLESILDIKPLSKESASKLREINDTLFKHVTTLKSLATDDALLETFLIHIVSKKLDPHSGREWESLKNGLDSELPSLEQFKAFLKNTANLLESPESTQSKPFVEKSKVHLKSHVTSNPTCSLCKGAHPLTKCDKFLKLSSQDRTAKAKELKRINISESTSLLQPKTSVTNEIEPEVTVSAFSADKGQILLPTVSAQAFDSKGNAHTVRILLDSASQSNFIRTSLCEKLNLPTERVNISISG
ncbi:Protein of unknown function (DUF1759) [Popillia japonica]|uniref:Peptidase aspartic putative domain-containing protein n=1 Tax=Popillia japonica TaxID=7064 RepID=A0AAW1IFY1_POPJA